MSPSTKIEDKRIELEKEEEEVDSSSTEVSTSSSSDEEGDVRSETVKVTANEVEDLR